MRRLAVLLLLLAAGCGGAPADNLTAPSPAAPPQPVAGCPDEFVAGDSEPWVPERPTTDTDGRLVPDADPVEATICRYGALREEPSLLDGEMTLEGGLDRIRHDLLLPRKLDGASRACTAIGGARVPHLMRLSYADGDLWISSVQDANSCEDTGNGDFVSGAYLGDDLAASYDAGAWSLARRDGSCLALGHGRAGQEEALVPDGWVSLSVCTPSSQGEPQPARELEQDAAQRVADVMGGLSPRPDSSGCQGPSRQSYNLTFGYPEGPPVSLWFAAGCDPALHNGSLEAEVSQEKQAELEDLLRAP